MSTLRELGQAEEGQALIWGAGVMILIVALFYGAIDIGQLVLGKIEAQNAADAAAMTGSALKTSMHNTRSLAYRAASGQLELCRLQMVHATGIALHQIGKPSPGGKASKEFTDAMQKAHLHRRKLELLRDGILAFNEFATGKKAGPDAVKEAASAAYRANLGTLGIEIRSNLNLVDSPAALPEISGGAANGTLFRAEALSPNGKAGKTAVIITPSVTAFGGGLLGYSDIAQLSAAAVAGPVEAHDQFGKGLRAVDNYGIEWYTTRLLPVGKGSLGHN
jgi:hypothetical protein